jgi:hypothetical protein
MSIKNEMNIDAIRMFKRNFIRYNCAMLKD